MPMPHPFARRVFQLAAVYGLLALLPQYLLEDHIGRQFPPAISHPEQFYGFIGVALAWQFAFLLVAHDPARYRPLMPVAVLEKLAFGVPAVLLWWQGRAPGAVAAVGGVDLVLAAAFALAFRLTRPATA